MKENHKVPLKHNIIYHKFLTLIINSQSIFKRKFFKIDQYSSYLGREIKVRYKNQQNENESVKG